MSDSIHETAATPSVSLAAVVTHDSIPDSIHQTAATPSVSLAAVAMCVCVFSKTMYLDRERYTVFWPYTV